MALAVISPEPLEQLMVRANGQGWTIPCYSSASNSFSEDMGFLGVDSHAGVAGIVVCQLEAEEIYIAAKAPFGPAPFCSMWIFAELLNGYT